MKTTPTPKGARTDPGSYSWKLLLIKDARVHYVVLKQQPRTTHPTRTHKRANRVLAAAGKPETQVPGKTPVLLSQDPTVCQTLNRLSPVRTVPGHAPSRGNSIRTGCRQETGGRYLLIFHP